MNDIADTQVGERSYTSAVIVHSLVVSAQHARQPVRRQRLQHREFGSGIVVIITGAT